MSGGGGNTTSNSVATPWSGQQPYLSNVFGNAQGTYNGFAGNPSSSVAGMTGQQTQAIGNAQNIASGTNFNGASSVNNAASGFDAGLVNGEYQNANPGNSAFQQFASGSMSNPYTSNAMDAANNAITRAYQTATAPDTASQFAAAGRYGSGAMANAVSQNQQNLATQLGNTDASLANTMYQENAQNQLAGAQGLSSNWNSALQQRLQGAGLSGGIATSINDANSNLYNMGGNLQSYNQSVINAPWQLLNNYSNLIQGQYGGNTTTTTPYYTNTAAGILGGSLAGSALASGMGYNSGYGAVAGGLMGAL